MAASSAGRTAWSPHPFIDICCAFACFVWGCNAKSAVPDVGTEVSAVDDGTGQKDALPDDSLCDDGKDCAVDDVGNKDGITGDALCDDGDDCTTDHFDVASKSCRHLPVAGCLHFPCLDHSDCPLRFCDRHNVCVPCLGRYLPFRQDTVGCFGNCVHGACHPGSSCHSENDCKSTAQFCPINFDVPVCVDCLIDTDCGANARCEGDACVAALPACATSSDCGPTEYCSDFGECEPRVCTSNSCTSSHWMACLPDGSGFAGAEDSNSHPWSGVGPKSVNCSDKDPCTLDTCEPATGCKHTAIASCVP